MLHRRTFLTLCAAALVSLPAFAAGDDPQAIVAAIYKKATGDVGGNFIFQEHADRQKYWSKETTALWKAADDRTAEGDQNPPGFDPVSSSQDPMIKDPKVTVKERGKDTTVIQASFLTYEKKGKRTTVLYDMKREDGRWVIDDIRGTVDGKWWSIKQIVRDWD